MKKILCVIGCVIVICMILTRCSTLKKSQKDLRYIQVQHPELLTDYCAVTFPLRIDSIKTDTHPIYKPATNIDFTSKLDSLNQLADHIKDSAKKAFDEAILAQTNNTPCITTIKQLQVKYQSQYNLLYNTYQNLRDKYKPCVPDTIIYHDTAFIPNDALIKNLNNKIAIQGSQLADKDKTISTKNKYMWGFWIVIIALALYLLRNPIIGLIKKLIIKKN